MKHSDSITKLAAALTKAQAEMKPAEKNASNPFLKSKFADLGAVIETARAPLAKNELSLSQFPVAQEGQIGVDTILMHSSGEWLSEAVFLPLGEERGKSQAQVMGSIITYLRRYSYASVLGIYADEDEDAQPRQSQQQQHQAPPPKSEAPKVGNIGGDPFHPPQSEGSIVPAELKALLKTFEKRMYPPDKLEGARGLAVGTLDDYAGDVGRRLTFLKAVFNKDSSKQLTDGEIAAILKWKDAPNAKSEVNRVIADYLKAQGQQELFEGTPVPD